MKPYFLLFTLIVWNTAGLSQISWKMLGDKNGIKIYTGSIEDSKFKSVKVIADFDGTIIKLMNILSDIDNHTEWVYKTKSASVIKKINAKEFIYYTESMAPWPISNRDAIIHLTMVPEADKDILRITAVSEPTHIAKKDGLVRIPYSKASWYVTQSANQLHIEYIFEIDPGGTLPVWLVNMMLDKGPYESFQKLREILKR